MTTPTPLSPSAQAVRRDLAQIMQELNRHCRVSVSATDTLPITLETNDASLQAAIDSLCAAALRAAADQLGESRAPGAEFENLYGRIVEVSDLLAIAAELDGSNPSESD